MPERRTSDPRTLDPRVEKGSPRYTGVNESRGEPRLSPRDAGSSRYTGVSDPRGEPRLSPRDAGSSRYTGVSDPRGEPRLSPRDAGSSRYPADPRVKRVDPRIADEYRFPGGYGQDSDLRRPGEQDIDLRMTPSSYRPS